MSVFSFVRTAARLGGRSAGSGPLERLARLIEGNARRLWLLDRGLAELRWAAVTLGTMALIGWIAGLLHASDAFDGVRIVATPATVLAAAAAWGPYADRMGRSRAVRLALGPAVLAVAVLGSGSADIATLQLPPAAPLIVLAMAYAAMTPGYPIAATSMLCSSVSILLAHALGSFAPAATVGATDGFVVSVVVTFLASAGMAIVVRLAIDAEARANRLAATSRERRHAIERVAAVNRALVADLDRPRIVSTIVDAAADLLGADFVVLISRRPDHHFRVEAGRGVPAEAIGSEILPGDGLAGRCIADRARTEGVLDSPSWAPDHRAQRPGGGTPHAAMALPILMGEAVEGVLSVGRIGAERGFSELERGIADLLVAQVAIALRNADLHAKVAESALRDPLTGLLNRRYFDEAIETAHANAQRDGGQLCLIVLDLDHFSAVNNEHGHSVGDTVLRSVAKSIKRAVREGDVVARYGGEEFVVIAPGTDGEGAVATAERIRRAVARAGTKPIDGQLIPLTISAGVACLVDAADGRGLFRAADSALLAAKRAGRDRVARN